MRCQRAAALALFFCCEASTGQSHDGDGLDAGDATARSIVALGEDLYRFGAGEHFGLYWITTAGAVVIDPHDRATAEWLQQEILRRHGQPVRHVIYSHFHYDHASGAAAFGPEVRIVAHRHTKQLLQPPTASSLLPFEDAARDANRDGLVQPDEADAMFADRFAHFDADSSGALDARELHLARYAEVRAPNLTFGRELRYRVGKHTVRLIHVGGRHAADMTLIYFPHRAVLYAADVIAVRRLPADLDTYDVASDSFPIIERALRLKPRIASPAHGAVGNRGSLQEYLRYVRELVDGVQAGILAGASLQHIQSALTLEAYRDWQRYADWRERNIAGIYQQLVGR